jgi:hypothetical protein
MVRARKVVAVLALPVILAVVFGGLRVSVRADLGQ